MRIIIETTAGILTRVTADQGVEVLVLDNGDTIAKADDGSIAVSTGSVTRIEMSPGASADFQFGDRAGEDHDRYGDRDTGD